MKIEKLAENKIVVTLTSDDLNGLNINIHSLHDDKGTLNKFLIHVMEVIREETDFNPYNGQVVVEACSISEGLMITVSKLKENVKELARKALKDSKNIKVNAKIKPKRTESFYFDKFTDLCNALIRIESTLYNKCEIYKFNGTYCLLLCCDRFTLENKDTYMRIACVLAEYSRRSSMHSRQYCHIKEHGELIASGDKLVSMINGLKKINSQ